MDFKHKKALTWIEFEHFKFLYVCITNYSETFLNQVVTYVFQRQENLLKIQWPLNIIFTVIFIEKYPAKEYLPFQYCILIKIICKSKIN